jgi:hypothetical protein
MNAGRKILAALGMLTGAIGIVTAWGLLFEGGKSPVLIAIEVGGVAIFLIGYFLWKKQKGGSPNKPTS